MTIWMNGILNDVYYPRVVSDVIRTNEWQAWFVAEHVVDTAVVHVE
jgi:hypothetical protein